MKIRSFGVALLATLAFFSCGKKEEMKTVIRPVKVTRVASQNELQKDYSGVVEAVNFVKLAFRVPGQIIALPIIEGQRVEKGDLIAQLDPREINVQFSSAKAQYETAKAQLERNERLLKRQAVSRQEMEMVTAKYEQAKSNYDAQKNNLTDTYLRAPFSGFIQTRSVENYQRIQAGLPVVELVDPKDLQVFFTIPDRAISNINNPNLTFYVTFENVGQTRYKAELKEFVDASPNGAGIPVYLKITDPRFNKEEIVVKPGFACNVTMIMKESGEASNTHVPLTAILGDPTSSNKYVWIYDKANSVVNKRKIETGSLLGKGDIIITSGVKVGEEVVIAGVTQLTEGEKVKILK